jgi:hypothetical protein
MIRKLKTNTLEKQILSALCILTAGVAITFPYKNNEDMEDVRLGMYLGANAALGVSFIYREKRLRDLEKNKRGYH